MAYSGHTCQSFNTVFRVNLVLQTKEKHAIYFMFLVHCNINSFKILHFIDLFGRLSFINLYRCIGLIWFRPTLPSKNNVIAF